MPCAGRAVPLIVLSAFVHVAALGVALGLWTTSRFRAPGTSQVIVVVDLAPASPASDSASLVPVDRPTSDVLDADALSRRIADLSAENVGLSATIREQRQRTAQLQAEHGQELAALKTAHSQVGEELAAIAADRQALSAELAAARAQATALARELASRQQAEQAALDEVTATYERLVSALEAEIAARNVALERANARVTVAFVDRVLLPSGQAALTTAGERVIDKVATAWRA
jgi:septal ring factor EnvC (AmiA/AmiB activator)